MPTSAHDDHYNFNGPHEGTVIRMQTQYGETNVTFLEPALALTGYHEWRRSVPVEVEHPSSEDLSVRLIFDKATGLSLGNRYAFEESSPALPISGFEVVPVDYEYEFEGRAYGISVDLWFPESVLWGRILRVGDAWTVSTLEPWLMTTSTSVTIEQGPGESKVAFVTLEKTSTSRQYTYQWRITIGTGDWAIGSERELRVQTSDNSEWSDWWSFPATVLDDGLANIYWGGASHTAFVAAPDASLTYAGVAALPDDPNPHPLFDIAEASAVALSSDEGEIRSFLARAPEPQLTRARVAFASTAGGYTHWRLSYDEPGGHALDISMLAAKTLAGPLIPVSVAAHVWALPEVPLASLDLSNISTATPGSYARLAETFAAEEHRLLTGLSWQAHGFAQPLVELGLTLAPPQSHPYGSCLQDYTADGATGIVIATHTSSYGFSATERCDDHLEPLSNV